MGLTSEVNGNTSDSSDGKNYKNTLRHTVYIYIHFSDERNDVKLKEISPAYEVSVEPSVTLPPPLKNITEPPDNKRDVSLFEIRLKLTHYIIRPIH